MKKVDIIIPAYNARDTLFKALCSVATQKVSDLISVCIVDDASYCSYDDILSNFRNDLTITYHRMESNIGPGNCRQFGMDHTSCKYIMFLDADDQFFNQFAVGGLLGAIEHDDLHFVISDFFEELTDDKGLFLHKEDHTWMFSKIYKRSFLEEKGIRFNENGSYANEDSGFNSMVFSLVSSNKFMHFPFPTYTWSGNKNSITRSNNREYTFSKGFRGFIDNQIYAIEFLKDRKDSDQHKVRDQILSNLLTCFSTSLDVVLSVSHADKTQLVLEISKEFYNRYKDIIKEMLVTPDFIHHYHRSMEHKPIHPVSIYNFLSAIDEDLDVNELLNQHIAMMNNIPVQNNPPS